MQNSAATSFGCPGCQAFLVNAEGRAGITAAHKYGDDPESRQAYQRRLSFYQFLVLQCRQEDWLWAASFGITDDELKLLVEKQRKPTDEIELELEDLASRVLSKLFAGEPTTLVEEVEDI